MTDFLIEDADNIRNIVLHYCGVPQTVQEIKVYDALYNDLLRYCTRLRNQPNLKAHTEGCGVESWEVPAHELITD